MLGKEINRTMENAKNVARLAHDVLNKREEGITNYVFHEIEKQTEDIIIVRVSYTWSLHGHKKPVENIQCAIYKENGIWKQLV